jgi:hypothetical protein
MELFFFATKEDLKNTLQKVQEKVKIKYIKKGIYNSPNEVIEYRSISELSGFGVNMSGDHSTDSFLVMYEEDKVTIEKVAQHEGGYKFFVDQGSNVDSIELWPGGLYDDSFLISGEIATISNSEKSKILFKTFSNLIKKNYQKISGSRYYVSSGIDDIKNKIRLITMTVKQPIEYDLKY